MSKPIADSSPGDEMDELDEVLLDVWNNGDSQHDSYPPDRDSEFAEAKDRLNRLMLTRERERLEKLLPKFVHVLPNGVEAYVSSIEAEEAIKKELKTIDAQLNKEEK